MKIKMQTAIIGIAVGIFMLLSIKKEEVLQKIRQYAYTLLCFLLGLILASGIVSICTVHTGLQIDKSLSKTPLHYLMMGLNEETNGVFNEDDMWFSLSYSDKNERTVAELKEIKKRVNNLGPRGMIDLWKRKILTNYNDGSFAWWEEGSFYVDNPRTEKNIVSVFLENYYYRSGEQFVVFINIVHIMWMGVLVLNVFCLFIKKENPLISIMLLSLIGIFVFELLFEARARYIFTYVPIYILVACGNSQNIVAKVISNSKDI